MGTTTNNCQDSQTSQPVCALSSLLFFLLLPLLSSSFSFLQPLPSQISRWLTCRRLISILSVSCQDSLSISKNSPWLFKTKATEQGNLKVNFNFYPASYNYPSPHSISPSLLSWAKFTAVFLSAAVDSDEASSVLLHSVVQDQTSKTLTPCTSQGKRTPLLQNSLHFLLRNWQTYHTCGLPLPLSSGQNKGRIASCLWRPSPSFILYSEGHYEK